MQRPGMPHPRGDRRHADSSHAALPSRGPAAWILATVLGGLLTLLVVQDTRAAESARSPVATPVDFNRDVRPILSDKCYACHGPDARTLRGDLRLDLADRATQPAASGARAIVPGHPEDSELVRRIHSGDPDEQMPPPDAHQQLTDAERGILRQWVLEGAEYQQHWAFLPPARVEPPAIDHASWSRHPIDRFVRAELARAGMEPAPEADRATLIRRLSLDLRGIPPTPDEVDEFLRDTSEGAYERLVDRMLGSPRFGERMATLWLDLARYGDTNGYHADSDRPVWVWRDWVIDAYNRNLPFDQFTTWQLAGDLLPDATEEQRIASGFNRNVRFNEEGGADPAEFLTVYAADRVITLGRVWLGLTLNCAQCHSHKYDPVTQAEFYQLTAFFNSLEEEGAGGETGFHGKPVPPVLRVTPPRVAAKRRTLETQLRSTQRDLDSRLSLFDYREPDAGEPAKQKQPTAAVDASQSAWEASIANFQPPAIPSALAHWDFRVGLRNQRDPRPAITDNSTQDASPRPDSLDLILQGDARLTSEGLALDGKAAHAISPVSNQPLRAKTFEAWVLLDDRPAEIRGDASAAPGSGLSQQGGAVLGVQTLEGNPATQKFDAIVFGEREPQRWLAGSDSFHRTEDVGGAAESEADRQFVHVAIRYAEDGLIQIFRQGQPYGRAYRKGDLQEFAAGQWRVMFGARALPPGGNYMLRGTIREARLFDRPLTDEEIAACAGTSSPGVPAPILAAIHTPRAARSGSQQAALRDYYLRHVHAGARQATTEPRQRVAWLAQRLAELPSHDSLPLQMVSVEMPQPRPAYLLVRGDFQARGDQVTRAVPAFLPPFPANQPANRLGLARWLMLDTQPLVARVQVNRFWQMLFGEGIVRTVGDFGLQGDYPSHPELLDWLSRQFVESGWDVKQTLRRILTSQTYRQASDDTRRYAEADPRNERLWRGPRVRLSAELVRDNALSIAGLLSNRIGGPSVFPYQPADFYRGKNNGWQWNTSQGEDLHRRGLYTFWRRTTPYPSFVIFDAPDRAECTFERPRTNTPLQALVTLNDPQFMDAARALAERLLRDPDRSDDERIQQGFRLAVAREPSAQERQLLGRFVAGQKAIYAADETAANALLVGPSGADRDPATRATRAAWVTFANVLLNLDETITRN